MPITLNGDTGIQTPMYNGTITANAVTPSVNMKNRIINGNMSIDQRNAGASVTPTTSGDWYGADRWIYNLTQSSKFSSQQSSTAPTGFINSILITSLSAYSVAAGDVFALTQQIEGLNVGDLGWGTASDYLVQYGSGASTSACTSIPSINDANENHVTIIGTCSAVLTAGSGSQLMANNNKTSYLLLTAEL